MNKFETKFEDETNKYLKMLREEEKSNPKTALMEVAEDGTLEELKELLNEGTENVHAVDKFGATALVWAAEYSDDPLIIEALIKAGADIHSKIYNDSWTPLIACAASNDNPEILKTLLKYGADINATDGQGANALHWACAENTPTIVETLIKNGININSPDFIGDSPLIAAAKVSDDPDIILKLVELGVDIDMKNNKGETALMYACKENTNPEITEALIKSGADTTIRDKDFNSTFYYAGLNPNPEILCRLIALGVDFEMEPELISKITFGAISFSTTMDSIKPLIEKGIDINELSDGIPLLEDGEELKGKASPFMSACMYNYNAEMIRELIKAGGDPKKNNEAGISPLMLAVSTNPNPEVMDILSQYDTNINAIDYSAKFVIQYANENSNPSIPVKLIEQGANIELLDKETLNELLLKSIGFAQKTETLQKFMELGMDIGKDNFNGQNWNSLMLASACNSSPKVIELIIDKTISAKNIDKENDDDMTALTLAAGRNPNPEIVELLIKKGAKLKRKYKNKMTPLIWAAQGNNVAVVEKIIQLGANVNEVDGQGLSPLLHAAEFNSDPDVVRKLIELGANKNYREKEGANALILAAMFTENPDVLTALVECGLDVNSKIPKTNSSAVMLAFIRHENSEDGCEEILERLFELGANDEFIERVKRPVF